MITDHIQQTSPPLHWIDVIDPTSVELQKLEERFHLDPLQLQECLRPVHLPKFQDGEKYIFVILRAFDEQAGGGETVQAFTRKLAIFFGEDFLITIRRKEQQFYQLFVEEVKGLFKKNTVPSKDKIFRLLITHILSSYEKPIYAAESAIDQLEPKAFSSRISRSDLQELANIKRRTVVIRRTLWRTLGILHLLEEKAGKARSKWRPVLELAERNHYYAEEVEHGVSEATNFHITMNNLQISYASHRTSEIMRVLTIFSVFFLPLTFIVGLYGMNFSYMPELHWRWGYPVVLGTMALICALLFLWFKRQGLLQWGHKSEQ